MAISDQAPAPASVRQPPVARVLLVLYLVLFVVCGIAPKARDVWFAENLPIWIMVGFLLWLARRQRLSTGAWLWLSVFPALHTIGGHYTFAEVPFGLVTDTFGFERNHFDRVAHFTVGFLAYPLAEILLRRRWVTTAVVGYLFPLFAIMALAAAYELFEWQYAVLGDPEAGHAVLGSQGDVWDAQKDMLADTLGACVALVAFRMGMGRRRERFGG